MTLHIGYHVHPVLTYQRPYSAEDKARLWAHLDKIQPSALLFLNNVSDAWQAKSRYPSCVVVHRTHYAEEGGLYKTISPQEFYNRHAKEGDNGIVVNCLNEPSGYQSADDHKRMASWCAEVMELFGKAGKAVVTPNWGVGHPRENSYADFTELWDAFKAWPLHYLGVHEYWAYKGIEAGNGRVGRFLWLIAYLRGQGYPFPNLLFTEWGCDDLLDGSGKRGWRDSRTETAYAAECLEAARRYYDFSYVKGVCLFSWGNSGRKDSAEDWKTHDVSDAMEYQAMIEQAYKPEDKPTVNEPILGEYNRVIVPTDLGHVNLRSEPDSHSLDLGDVITGDVLYVYAGSRRSANGNIWVRVDHWRGGEKRNTGYMAVLPGVIYEKADKPELPATFDARQAYVNLLQAEICYHDAAIKNHQAQINLLLKMAESLNPQTHELKLENVA